MKDDNGLKELRSWTEKNFNQLIEKGCFTILNKVNSDF